MESKGHLYRVRSDAIEEIAVVDRFRGLRDADRKILKTIIVLASSTPTLVIDQAKVSEKTNMSLSTVKVRVTAMAKQGLFKRDTFKRRDARSGSIYTLARLIDATENPALVTPRKEAAARSPESDLATRSIIRKSDLARLESQDGYRVSYSRKVNWLILARCSADESLLAKKIPMMIPGISEKVYVVQRTMSGIPPMNGSEDRLQQALLTMLKEALKRHKMTHGDLEGVRNEWLIDLRDVCRVMGLVGSGANLDIQARKLFQLRYNAFEVHFTPGGLAEKSFRFDDGDGMTQLFRSSDGETHAISASYLEHSFLTSLQPFGNIHVAAGDGLTTQDTLFDAELDEELGADDADAGIDDLIRDKHGKVYRFYKISLHPRIFAECVSEELRQIFVQPASLLSEDRVIVRALVELAQRVCRKTRKDPFSVSWGTVISEIQPLADKRNTLKLMRTTFAAEHERQYSGTKWEPRKPNAVRLHGYVFFTDVPARAGRNMAAWILTIARDLDHPITGDNSTASKMAAKQTTDDQMIILLRKK